MLSLAVVTNILQYGAAPNATSILSAMKKTMNSYLQLLDMFFQEFDKDPSAEYNEAGNDLGSVALGTEISLSWDQIC